MPRITVAPRQEPLFIVDHKDIYRQIRNYLAGRLVGATRDRALLHEVLKSLFSLVHMRRAGHHSASPESPETIAAQYAASFEEVKSALPNLFAPNETFTLDAEALAYIDRLIAPIDFDSPAGDPIGDVYEAFVGSSVRSAEGQFFTPRQAVSLLVALADPQPGETIIDPACGAGGFLNTAARHLITRGADRQTISDSVVGVDKDAYLYQSRIATPRFPAIRAAW